MIILDTNVVSETMRDRPAQQVLDWLDRQNAETVFFDSDHRGGIKDWRRFDARRSATSRSKERNGAYRHNFFCDRILPFDHQATTAYAAIQATRRQLGRPIQQADCMIAAIARTHHMNVATRDRGGFEDCGIDLIDPWQSD